MRDLRPRTVGPYWLAVLVVVGIGGLVWLFGFTAVLGVEAVDVTGAPIAGADQIRAVAAVADGTPLARVDTDAVADRVRSVASVASVDVGRSWPSTLIIAVTERVPVAVVARDGVFFVVDREGVVFNQVAQPPEGVVDLTVANPGPDDPTTLAALRVLAALTPELRAQTVAVAADSPYADPAAAARGPPGPVGRRRAQRTQGHGGHVAAGRGRVDDRRQRARRGNDPVIMSVAEAGDTP